MTKTNKQYTVDPAAALGAFTGRTIKKARRLRRTVRRRVLWALDQAAEVKDRIYERGKEIADSLLAIEDVQRGMGRSENDHETKRIGERGTSADALRRYKNDGNRRQMGNR